ncbi:MAG TPA: radical SAM protein [Candidatus Faecimonas gallistercoris]|nr:radical SAM protein [Candidatus Faecimonas gallistercoris]
MEYKVFNSSEGNVWKYVFTKDDIVLEAVLYKYNDFYERTVICCSVMSGCPVGCKFCGTGANFIRNLTSDEIVEQILSVLRDKKIITDINEKCKKLQFMFMSMGEPMLNWTEVEKAIRILHKKFSNAQLLLSTIGCNNDDVFSQIISLSKEIDKVGLQFSIHKSDDIQRSKLIPFHKKMNLEKIRDAGIIWWKETNRKPFLNYCIDGTNNTEEDFINLTHLFSPVIFNFTFSVVCSKNENMKEKSFRNLEIINNFQNKFLEKGYNVRMFNPAGQDDIGGGCGQLWYVQDWLRKHKKIK